MKKSFRTLLVGAAVLLGLGALANAGSFALKKEMKEAKADAEITGDVYVGSNKLTAGTPFSGTTGNIVYNVDAANNKATITLNSFSIETTGHQQGDYTGALCVTLGSNTSGFNLDVVVNGNNNSITEKSSGDVKSCGFYYSKYSNTKAVNFLGESTSKLELSGGSSNTFTAGMYSQARIVVNGPQIKMTSKNATQSGGKAYGLNAYQGLEVQSGKVSLIGGHATVSGAQSIGLYRSNNSIDIKGGEFEAKGETSGAGISTGIDLYNNGVIRFTRGTSTIYGKNHGINNSGWVYSDLYVENTIDDVTIKSEQWAIRSKDGSDDLVYVHNKIPGTGWLNYDQSDTPATIAIASGGQFIETVYKVVNFVVPTVQATITGFTGPYDGNPHSISVTNLDPSNATVKYSENGSTYSSTNPSYTAVGEYTVYYRLSADGYKNKEGSAKVIIEGLPNGWSTLPAPASDLVYNNGEQSLLSTLGVATHGTVQYKVDSGEFSTATPTAKNAGTYHVICHIDAEAQYDPVEDKEFDVTIAKAPNQYKTEPAAVEDQLPYTGEPITLSVPGSVLGGTVLYKLGTGDYSEDLPTATNLGVYTVYYKAVGNENYNDIAERSFNVEIVKGVPTFATEPAALEGLNYTGQDRPLVSAGSSDDGVVKYSLSQEGPFATDIPTGKNVGEYTVYYMIEGDANHNDSQVKNVKVSILENDKTALVAAIAEADVLYNDIKDGYPTVAETLKDAIDTAKEVNGNENVTVQQIQDAIDALNVAIDKAIEDSRDVVVDEKSGVSVETSDGTPIPTNINLKVEVRSDVKANKETAKEANVKKLLKSNEYISHIFDIKLIKTEGGVESEIQPSDIKEGMKIIITIDLPEGVDSSKLRLLHIHSATDVELVENFTSENNQVKFETSKLSQIALLSQAKNSGLPAWAIVLIVLGSLILLLGLCYLALFFLFNKWIKKDDKAVRAFKFGKKDDQVRLMTMCFKFEYRPENEVFNSKEDALK